MAKQAKTPEVDPDLAAACASLGVDPATVWDWKAYEDRVVVIAADGRKLVWQR